MNHGGSGSKYAHGTCRCKVCCAANTRRAQQQREARRIRLLADPTLAPHGRRSTYTNWGCRCDECTVANTEACRDYNRVKW